MRWQDIIVGEEVYHRTFTHFGKGVVVAVTDKNGLEVLFEKRGGPKRIVVKFEAHNDTTRVIPAALTPKPNMRRIREMIQFYANRNVTAYEQNGRLMIERQPETAETTP